MYAHVIVCKIEPNSKLQRKPVDSGIRVKSRGDCKVGSPRWRPFFRLKMGWVCFLLQMRIDHLIILIYIYYMYIYIYNWYLHPQIIRYCLVWETHRNAQWSLANGVLFRLTIYYDILQSVGGRFISLLLNDFSPPRQSPVMWLVPLPQLSGPRGSIGHWSCSASHRWRNTIFQLGHDMIFAAIQPDLGDTRVPDSEVGVDSEFGRDLSIFSDWCRISCYQKGHV